MAVSLLDARSQSKLDIGFVFDKNSNAALLKQISDREAGVDGPVRWEEFVEQISREETGSGPADRHWSEALCGRATLLAWHFSVAAISVANFRPKRLAYLCWGVVRPQKPHQRIYPNVLRRAGRILVNDATTQAEILTTTSRRASMVPFFIDTSYYRFKPLADRDSYLFCSGSNDRDPEHLVALAERGYRIVWLVNDRDIVDRYARRHKNLELVSRISFGELRELYQRCRAFIMPASRDAHCAGQTTGQEAIACGAPVVISRGRTASIFSGVPSVCVPEGADVEDWAAAIESLSARPRLDVDVAMSREMIAQRLSRERVKSELLRALCGDALCSVA